MNYGAELSIDLPPSTAFLQLDSKSRVDGQPVNNCELSKAGGYFSMDKAIRYSLQYVNFFWNIPNINERCNKIKFFIGATEYNVVLNSGFYNLAAFKTELEAKLNSAFGGFTVTILGATDGYKIAVQNGTSYTIASSGQDRSPWEMAGFSFEGNQTFTIHRGYPKLWYTRYIDVISVSLNRYQPIPDESSNYPTSNVLVRIFGDDGTSTNAIREDISSPLTQPHAVQFTSDFPKWVHFGRQNSNQGLGGTIDIKLIDEYGKVVFMEFPDTYPDYSLIFLTRSLE